MQKNVSVGVTGEAFIVLDMQATDHQRNAGLEGVRVKAISDAQTHRAPVAAACVRR